MVME
jgi:hypothetical protein